MKAQEVYVDPWSSIVLGVASFWIKPYINIDCPMKKGRRESKMLFAWGGRISCSGPMSAYTISNRCGNSCCLG